MERKVLTKLNQLAADGTVFYQKLRHYHWHVWGDRCYVLHEKFEELYTEWAKCVDEIAEHAVACGGTAPTTLRNVLEAARLREDASIPPAETMMENVARDLKSLIGFLDRTIGIATESRDGATVNVLERVRDAQIKHLWMVRAWLRTGPKPLAREATL